MSRDVYLDNAAATPIAKEVKKEMDRGMALYGNPSSYNDIGREARKALEEARLKVARFLGAHSQEVVFTSSGTEANNLAIRGVLGSLASKSEIITTPIEHPSVLESIKNQVQGRTLYLRVDKHGLIDPEDLRKKLTSKTVFVSVMYANNEIGTIEPIREISRIIKEIKNTKYDIRNTIYPLFHVDACQAAGYLDINVNRLGVDLLTFNGTKIYGPRGIGVLYVRRGVKLEPQTSGGDQEFGLRAGTENLPAILGLAKAVELVKHRMFNTKETKLRDYFIKQLQIKLPEAVLNGSVGNLRLANNVSISFPDLSSENILLEL